MISDEDIGKAQEAQTEYWDNVYKRMDFFKTSKLSNKNMRDVRDMEVLDKNILIYAELSNNNGNEVIARYWLDMHVKDHIDTMWRHTFESLKTRISSDKAIELADHMKNSLYAHMKGRFP